jgi:hypothetical protein
MTKKTNIDQTLVVFNEQQRTIKFTIEKELHHSNFLDLSMHHGEKEMEYANTENRLKQIL